MISINFPPSDARVVLGTEIFAILNRCTTTLPTAFMYLTYRYIYRPKSMCVTYKPKGLGCSDSCGRAKQEHTIKDMLVYKLYRHHMVPSYDCFILYY